MHFKKNRKSGLLNLSAKTGNQTKHSRIHYVNQRHLTKKYKTILDQNSTKIYGKQTARSKNVRKKRKI
jgi:hypothetical protein